MLSGVVPVRPRIRFDGQPSPLSFLRAGACEPSSSTGARSVRALYRTRVSRAMCTCRAVHVAAIKGGL